MGYISKQLANEIREKHAYLQKLEKYDVACQCRKKLEKKIEQEAQVQSYEIEHPFAKIPFSVPRNGNKRKIKEGIENIKVAFDWGIENYDPKSIDEEFIRTIASKILPEYHKGLLAQYRDYDARIIGGFKIPPGPYKIKAIEMPRLITKLQKQLSGTDLIDKVIAARSTHFHIARIHPFEDGNGRTARTLQDIILTANGLPVPLLGSGERNIYYNCLEYAKKGWADNQAQDITHGASEGERFFFDLIAGKINTSLDNIIEVCPLK